MENEEEINQSNEPLGSSLIKAITDPALEVIVDMSEALWDQCLSDGWIRDMPIIGSIMNTARIYKNVSNYLFYEKVRRFLITVNSIPMNKKEKFARKMEADERFRKRVGENLVLLLHRLDDMNKTEYLGTAFKAYIEGKIDYSKYIRLGRAIDMVTLQNSDALIEFYANGNNHVLGEDEIMQDLAIAGLVNFTTIKGTPVGPLEGFDRNELGRIFIDIVLER